MLPGAEPVVEVLVVCTGNVCRSPALEMMLRNGLGGRPGWQDRGVRVASSGTAALVGRPLEPEVRTNLVRLGVAVDDGFEARLLTPEMVAAASLVLCAARVHRAWLARAVPTAMPKTFTMLEFARSSRAFPTGPAAAPGGALGPRVTALLEFAQRERGRGAAPRPADDDVPDPYRRSAWAHRRSTRTIAGAAESILDAVTPA